MIKKSDSFIIFFREDRDIINGQNKSVTMLSIVTWRKHARKQIADFRAAEKSGVQILGVPILQGCVLVSDSEESMEYNLLQRGPPSFWRRS